MRESIDDARGIHELVWFRFSDLRNINPNESYVIGLVLFCLGYQI